MWRATWHVHVSGSGIDEGHGQPRIQIEMRARSRGIHDPTPEHTMADVEKFDPLVPLFGPDQPLDRLRRWLHHQRQP